MKRFRFSPGKFGSRRGMTNDETSEKTMKISAIPPSRIMFCVETAASTAGD